MARISFGRRRVILLLVLTSIILITLDGRGNPVINNARRAAAGVLAPLQDVGRAVVRPIDNAWNGMQHYEDLRKQNQQLRLENEQERGNSAAYLSVINDYQELLKSNDLPWLNQYERIAAQVVGPASNDFQQAIEINQGRTHGIREGMPVVCGAGLVGKITKAFDDTSVVLLLTDTGYTVAAKVSAVPADSANPTTTTSAPPAAGDVTTSTSAPPDTTTPATTRPSGPVSTTKTRGPSTSLAANPPTTTEAPTTVAETTTTAPFSVATLDPSTLRQIELGALQGNGAHAAPTLEFVAADQTSSAINVGDVVSTSGGATSNGLSLAPPGLPIGTVSKRTGRPGVAGPKLEVTPSCDLSHLSLLRVILYSPTTGS